MKLASEEGWVSAEFVVELPAGVLFYESLFCFDCGLFALVPTDEAALYAVFYSLAFSTLNISS